MNALHMLHGQITPSNSSGTTSSTCSTQTSTMPQALLVEFHAAVVVFSLLLLAVVPSWRSSTPPTFFCHSSLHLLFAMPLHLFPLCPGCAKEEEEARENPRQPRQLGSRAEPHNSSSTQQRRRERQQQQQLVRAAAGAAAERQGHKEQHQAQ